MVDNSILEPLKLYDSSLKGRFADEAKAYFDNLLKESKTDELLNKATVKKYNKAKEEAENAKDKLGFVKGLRIFLIIMAAIFFVLAFIFILTCFRENANLGLGIGVGVAGILLGIGTIVLIVLKVNKVIKDRAAKHKKLEEKANVLLNECYAQTRELCNLFDWNIPQKIVRKAAPLLQIDDYFDAKKFDLMNSKYGFGNILDKDTSTEMVVSGSIVGNPFLIVRNLHRFDSSKIYEGSLLITWTERTTDSEGHTRYETRSQTLIATVSKPCPGYEKNTYLVYGNEAAPNLSFMRSPTGLKKPDQKDIEKFVKKREKDLEDYADEAVSKNLSFTPMANVEFEALWGGWNRDHEVEYRLLFTALAQQSEIDLVTDNKYFGDDFYFEKRKCLNFVSSAHSQGCDYQVNPLDFNHYDVDVIRNNFMVKTTTYFESLFFDLAPLLAIPMYQQQKPIEYIYKDNYPTNYTSYEHETMANFMDQKYFAHPLSKTPAILKSSKVSKSGHTDKVLITAYSYDVIKRVDYVPTMGGDGHMHEVPVYWDEYVPIKNENLMAVRAIDSSRKQYDNRIGEITKKLNEMNAKGDIRFQRGLIGFPITKAYSEKEDEVLGKAFKEQNYLK